VQAIAERPDIDPPPDGDLCGGDVTVRLIAIEPGHDRVCVCTWRSRD
jgi:hypothetical protein